MYHKMSAKSPKLKPKKPLNPLFKPVKADFVPLFKALSKGIGHAVGLKWDELAADAVEAVAALGVETEPGELAFKRIHRAMAAAIFDLIGESAATAEPADPYAHRRQPGFLPPQRGNRNRPSIPRSPCRPSPSQTHAGHAPALARSASNSQTRYRRHSQPPSQLFRLRPQPGMAAQFQEYEP